LFIAVVRRAFRPLTEHLPPIKQESLLARLLKPLFDSIGC
jgi:hypothetical protein